MEQQTACHRFVPRKDAATALESVCARCGTLRLDEIHNIRIGHKRELSVTDREIALTMRMDHARQVLGPNHCRGEWPDTLGDLDGYGGISYAVIWYDTLRYVGIALCSGKDGFDHKLGGLIAAARANHQVHHGAFGCSVAAPRSGRTVKFIETPFRFSFQAGAYDGEPDWKRDIIDHMPKRLFTSQFDDRSTKPTERVRVYRDSDSGALSYVIGSPPKVV